MEPIEAPRVRACEGLQKAVLDAQASTSAAVALRFRFQGRRRLLKVPLNSATRTLGARKRGVPRAQVGRYVGGRHATPAQQLECFNDHKSGQT